MPAAPASALLRRKISLVIPAFVRAGDRLVAHPHVRELYPEYLFTSHCVIRASVPLMETARDAAAAREDRVSAALAPYLAHHIPEELDHDEWLLGDLESLGYDRAALLARPPSPAVASLVGAQYYWIHHFHPVALLGYIGLLEGYPPSLPLIDALQRGTGYERAAFRTMIAHAELDPGHGAELDELLDTLPLSREQSAVIGLSALHTVECYTRAIEELLEEFEEAA
jgi:pyrroloquinoline quinone (PQQ) biosynthesis protein C